MRPFQSLQTGRREPVLRIVLGVVGRVLVPKQDRTFAEPDVSDAALADYIGPHKILWATDYPHRDGFFPGAPQMMKERLKGLSADTQRGVMAGGAMQFYGLH